MLFADAAPRAPVFVDDDAVAAYIERLTADGALIDADPAGMIARSKARMGIPFSCSHVDIG